jgi:NADH:ubiquinone oxidoreductase subunit E
LPISLGGNCRVRENEWVESYWWAQVYPDMLVSQIARVCAELGLEARSKEERTGLILPVLRRVQEESGHISQEAIAELAACLEVPEAQVYSVATFYPWFKLGPQV